MEDASGKNTLWGDLLELFYGKEGVLNRSQQLVWWKDLNSIDNSVSYGRNWFSESMKLKFGDGKEVKFWTECWCNPWCLADYSHNWLLYRLILQVLYLSLDRGQVRCGAGTFGGAGLYQQRKKQQLRYCRNCCNRSVQKNSRLITDVGCTQSRSSSP